MQPPVYALLVYEPYAWCQVKAVIARELARSRNKLNDVQAWLESYDEASEFADAIRAGWGDTGLSFGARDGEVSWPDFACTAARYASAPPEVRREIRQAFASRQLSPILGPEPISAGLCPREIASDPDYQTTPPCYPKNAVAPAAAVVGGVMGGLLLGWVVLIVTGGRRGEASG